MGILAISGKKQSGKDTVAKFVQAINGIPGSSSFVDKLEFAGPLKEICVKLFGLTVNQVWGSDNDKNSFVPHMLWENVPIPTAKTGPMTAREVMQYWGTEIFRKVYPDIFVNALTKRISSEYTTIVIDMRFPNEFYKLKELGGKIIRLKRCPYDDQHDSETALDNIPDSEFDYVLDNRNMTKTDQLVELYPHLLEWKFVPKLPMYHVLRIAKNA